MTTWLRALVASVGWAAFVGVLTKWGFAARQVGAQDHLAQGLWPTALWIVPQETLHGAAGGGAGGALLVVSLACWPGARSALRPLPAPGAAPSTSGATPESALRPVVSSSTRAAVGAVQAAEFVSFRCWLLRENRTSRRGR